MNSLIKMAANHTLLDGVKLPTLVPRRPPAPITQAGAGACGVLTHRVALRFLLWEIRALPTCTVAVPRSTYTLLLINSVVLFTYCGNIAQHLHVPTAAPRSTCTLLLINSVVLFIYYGIPSQHTRAAANTWPSGFV